MRHHLLRQVEELAVAVLELLLGVFPTSMRSVDHAFHDTPETARAIAKQCVRPRRVVPDRGFRAVGGTKSASRIAYERQRWLGRGRNWRAGIEGRISGLKRGQGLERCRYHGDDGMQRWVGLGLSAHDLRVIAQATA